jgi:hypothetical protein
MYLKDALKLGEDCGLYSLPEAINNVLIHSPSLFEYSKLQSEEAELLAEARAAGVTFHECGMAMLDGHCYMCDKMVNLDD